MCARDRFTSQSTPDVRFADGSVYDGETLNAYFRGTALHYGTVAGGVRDEEV